MIPLKQLIQTEYKVETQTIAHSLRYAKSRLTLDLEVYLEEFGLNLQRPFVWTVEQKQSLIESVIHRNTRTIPPIAVVSRDDIQHGAYEVIDGKQRIGALLGFISDEYLLKIFGCGYFFSDLPQEYQNWILEYPLNAYVAYDLTDRQKIDWFTRINFAGTQQDRSHLERLRAILPQ